MHELGIAASVIDLVKTELARRPAGARLTKVGLDIGEFAGVDSESLTFCFEALVKDTEFAGAVLSIQSTHGEELDVRYVELEE